MHDNSIDTYLEEISRLRDGWLDGQGKQIHADVVRLAQEITHSEIWTKLDHSVASPTQSGGIIIEGDTQGWLISVNISPQCKLELSAFKPKDQFPPYIENCANTEEVLRILGDVI
jgi:hypothetical protein